MIDKIYLSKIFSINTRLDSFISMNELFFIIIEWEIIKVPQVKIS